MPQAGLKSTQEKGIGEVFTRPGDPYEFKKLPDGTYVTRLKGKGEFEPVKGGYDLIEAAFQEQFGQ